jgi:hypothetical protein
VKIVVDYDLIRDAAEYLHSEEYETGDKLFEIIEEQIKNPRDVYVIKDLEWEPGIPHVWHSRDHIYDIFHSTYSDTYYFSYRSERLSYHKTLDEAKAAANLHHKQRLESELTKL